MFKDLLVDKIQLNMVDGVILPNINMEENGEKCKFLNHEGRCSIHSFRPGICRMFPLGRYYENNNFKYFIQINECKKENKTKVKIKKFIGINDLKKYEKYICDWHYFLKDVEKFVYSNMKNNSENPIIKEISMFILNSFFISKYNKEDFYRQFYDRLEAVKKKYNLG